MARRVTWTKTAEADLHAIWMYIAGDSRMYAAAFVRRVRTKSRSLDESSKRGRIVPEVNADDIRELIIGNYRLIYQVTTHEVFVLRLIHGARLLPLVRRVRSG